MFEFLNPHLLYLIIPICLLVAFMYLKKKNTKNFIAFGDLKSIYKFSSNYLKIYYFIILLIFINIVLIISQPIERNIDEKIKKNGIDIMLVLDVSYSMKAEDLKPNRLDAAKEIISNFLEDQKNDRVGFVVFAGKPFTSLPLNFDYNISKKILDKINVDSINQRVPGLQGTAIGEALIFSADNFKDKNREKIMILLTDGATSEGNLDPIVAVNFLNEKYSNSEKIKIYTIGIGKNEKTFINIENIMGFSQKVEIGGVDEETLKIIAQKSGGKYFRAENKETLNNIFKTISNLEKTDIEIDRKETIKSQSKYFTYMLSILLLILLLIKARKHIYNR